MRIPFEELKDEFKRILLKLSFPDSTAETCATIFAINSRDGVYSHGLNRFPVFVRYVQQGLVQPKALPELLEKNGAIERWNGNFAPGMSNATHGMNRAIELSKENGIGCAVIKNTNHWMRGGTYGWQAADEGCIGICFTNATANMPAWGGQAPVLGNNPMVIAIPREGGHIVLDMAMSQFSYGKMQEYELKNESLPFPGGYDENGNLSTNPSLIRKSKRALPIGYWKGSGLALMLDLLVVALSGGNSTGKISANADETGVSQCFICIRQPHMHEELINQVIAYTKSASAVKPGEYVSYPGERTLRTRLENEKMGIPVNEVIWMQVKTMFT
ncbi:3-dehydro-L-gulonate 2-dehydrogenase [Pedobacter nyackensis]|uniref:3-dehydro-L-gulonate 2-dehydrogenase n=1 Tax=Pedobacter nyackensis TaxID=475255 RepID=A0A1W2EL66_9SPHI|nr:3-dehydro-L-gulonate 2-dehydrogenase [Pedobacter nyackensis]SMD10036.1 3-dehydro-L-gulonate 2-dehydrogenase [Pedobacter nyackensis]